MNMQDLISALPAVPQGNFQLNPVQKVPLPAKFHNWPPTPKQLKFYDSLVESKQMADDIRDEYRKVRPNLTRSAISTAIQTLVGLPYKPWSANTCTAPQGTNMYVQKTPVIPPQYRNYQKYGVGPRPASVQPGNNPMNQSVVKQGCYAIVDPLDNALKFYQVRCPSRGNWAGSTFVSQISGDNRFPIRDRQERLRVLVEIAKDATEALKRYGQEIGRCGHCKKQLTDAVSRQFGIGPVCRKALGI